MNRKIPIDHEAFFTRLNTRITTELKRKLDWACDLRERQTARRPTYGEIVVELGAHLETPPTDYVSPPAGVLKKEPSAEKTRRLRRKTMAAA